jgi:hypothetical protein
MRHYQNNIAPLSLACAVPASSVRQGHTDVAEQTSSQNIATKNIVLLLQL